MKRLLYIFLLATGLRDRLRCPACGAVGTYKLHDPAKNAEGGSVPWRWLCKWCGYYRDDSKSGMLCYPSARKSCWAFFDDKILDSIKYTPAAVLKEEMPNVWPWRG